MSAKIDDNLIAGSNDTNETYQERQKRRNLLQSYYGAQEVQAASDNGLAASTDPYDIDGKGFQPQMYLEQLLQKKTLTELMDKETEMTSSIRSLDSNMQTLVYENYNKFIGATDTIRKMKNDFITMEEEMDLLSQNMNNIVSFSGQIISRLEDRRTQMSQLYGVHTLLKKLQILFDLPSKLQTCMDNGEYSLAVRWYLKTKPVIQSYKGMPSFNGIHSECEILSKQLVEVLKLRFRNHESSAQQLCECVDLLLQLDEPPEELYQEYLKYAKEKLSQDLEELNKEIGIKQTAIESNKSITELKLPMDILEFVDTGCNKFLSNLCLVIASYTDMFLNKSLRTVNEELEVVALKILNQFVCELMDQYFQCVETRLKLEDSGSDTLILVRALDRFYRRLQAMSKLLPNADFACAGNDIVLRTSKERVDHSLEILKLQLADSITDIRHNLASPKLLGKSVQDGKMSLSDLLETLSKAVVSQVKTALDSLLKFIETGQTYALQRHFRNSFCSSVRQMLIQYLQHLYSVANEYCDSHTISGPALLLILARLTSDMGNSTIMYLFDYSDELFVSDISHATPVGALCEQFKEIGQRLLNHYVRIQGQAISQLLRKSVETRDWLNTIEPRTVRAVMKRVIEDITTIDTLVGQLFEEGVKKESSDSSRRTLNYSSVSKQPSKNNWTYASSLNSTLMSNIQKLFSEKIEIFSAIEFNKVSILTGIIKIGLKTFLECVRLRTFGCYGLQQIQVDTHYLQLYLWRFVSDESIVHSLLDEIVNSAVHRCVNPILMEPSVIELICDQG